MQELIIQVWTWMVDHADEVKVGTSLVTAAWTFFTMRVLLGRVTRIAETAAAIAATGAGDRLPGPAGSCTYGGGLAPDLLGQALDLYRRLMNRPGRDEVPDRHGATRRHWVDLDQARALYRHCLDLAREIDSAWGEAQALAGLARCDLASEAVGRGGTGWPWRWRSSGGSVPTRRARWRRNWPRWTPPARTTRNGSRPDQRRTGYRG
jgi:hypothetical protein